MNEKTKVGSAKMFTNKSDNPKAPKLRVLFELDGVKHEISLWGATDDNGNPKLTKNGDRYWSGPVERVGGAPPEPYDPGEYTPPEGDDADSLPF